MPFGTEGNLCVANCWETLESADTTLLLRSGLTDVPSSTFMAFAGLDDAWLLPRCAAAEVDNVLSRLVAPLPRRRPDVAPRSEIPC